MLTTDVLEDIVFTSGFEATLKSSINPQGVSHYMATSRGLFRVSPGMLLEKHYDASEQPWYRQSGLYHDRCVLTRAGYSPSGDERLVSISQAILDPRLVVDTTASRNPNRLLCII